jgi:predicted CxxxxCH...CXXCH cytochrome family protein
VKKKSIAAASLLTGFAMLMPGIASAGCFDCHETTACLTPTKPQGTCAGCHLGAGDANDYQSNFTIAVIDSGQWQSTGHGQANIVLACDYCHDDAVRHGDPANPFRLANTTTADATGQNANCLACHGTDAPGFDPDGQGTDFIAVNSVIKIDAGHAGGRHNELTDGGFFCWDCHDPHGDGNISMIHDEVTKQSDGQFGIPAETTPVSFIANATGSDYARSTAPFDGVCQACHTDTNHYTATSGDGHNNATRCVICHEHNEGFKPNCNACHGYPPLVDTPQGIDGLVVNPTPTGSLTSGAHQQHVVKYQISCYTCHFNGMPDTPIVGDYRLQMGFAVFGFSGNGSIYNAQPLDSLYRYSGTNGTTISTAGVATSCENFYCHSDGTAVSTSFFDPSTFPGPHQSSPAWDGATSCTSCHGFPPAYAADDPKANKHELHAGFGYTCNICHYGTTIDGATITNRSQHVNGQYDVAPDPTATVYVLGQIPTTVNFTYAYDPGGGTCASITCHANMGTSADRPWGFSAISAGVSWSPGSLCGSINFAINVTSANALPPYYYSIDWESDGSWDYEGTTNSHTHVYPRLNTSYNVTWTVRDAKMHTLDSGSKTTPVTSSAGAANVNPVPNVNRTNIVYNPVYGNPGAPAQITGYQVTLTDLSTDADFDACGHSGPGNARIVWRDGATDILPLDLTDTPSGQTFSHTYASGGNRYVQYYVSDNAGSSYIAISPNILVAVPNF